MYLDNELVFISAEEYFAHPATSRSAVASLVKADTPRHYWFKNEREGAEGFTGSLATQFGTAFHTLVLEPEFFDKENLFSPTGLDCRRNPGKAQWAALKAEATANGQQLFKGEDLEQLKLMRDSVMASAPDFVEALERGMTEATVFFKHEASGLDLKCRFDLLDPEGGVIYDLKTTSKGADEKHFGWTINDFRYDLQAAFYLMAANAAGLKMDRFVFVAVETKKGEFPGCQSHELSQAKLDAARAELEQALCDLAEYRRTGIWPAYPTEVCLHGEPELVPIPGAGLEDF